MQITIVLRSHDFNANDFYMAHIDRGTYSCERVMMPYFERVIKPLNLKELGFENG